jgi:serine/threonine protein kinase
MEKFDQNLGSYLQDFNHDRYKILEAIEQILDALHKIHNIGYSYNDLKTENVMVNYTKDGKI